MKKPKEQVMWATISPNGDYYHVSWHRKDAIAEHVGWLGQEWQISKKGGWRCIKVKVSPVKEGK